MSGPKRKSGSAKRRVPGRDPLTSALSHVDSRGRVQMVDVGGKPPTLRTAVARGRIRVRPRVVRLILSSEIAKGDPLQVARIGGNAKNALEQPRVGERPPPELHLADDVLLGHLSPMPTV